LITGLSPIHYLVMVGIPAEIGILPIRYRG